MKRRTHAMIAIGVCAGAVACTPLADFGRFSFLSGDMNDAVDLAQAPFDLVVPPPPDLALGDLAGSDLSGGLKSASNGYTCTSFLDDLTLGDAMVDTTSDPPMITPASGAPIQGEAQPNGAVFCLRSLTIPANDTVLVSGAKPFVVIAQYAIDIEGALRSPGGDGGGGGVNGGAGGLGGAGGDTGGAGLGQAGGKSADGRAGDNNTASDSGAGGAGGGGNAYQGGSGGADSAGIAGGLGGQANMADSTQIAGGGGGGGAIGPTSLPGGGGGGGGGTIQLSALGATGAIVIGAAGVIDLSGGGGGGGGYQASGVLASGGGGGGGGGSLWLEAETVSPSTNGSACISVVGGGGGNGGNEDNLPSNATHGKLCPYTSMTASKPFAGVGGAGQTSVGAPPGNGTKSSGSRPDSAGGGGGGAAGFVVVRSHAALGSAALQSFYPPGVAQTSAPF